MATGLEVLSLLSGNNQTGIPPVPLGSTGFTMETSPLTVDIPANSGAKLFDAQANLAGSGGGGLGPLGIASMAMSGLQTLGSLWMANKQHKLAKKQFKMIRDISNINLGNQMQSYNTALADRARGRGVMEGQTSDQVSQYINSNSLNRERALGGGSSASDITSAALSNYNTYIGRNRDQNRERPGG
jgi:hypothetical protein